MPEKITNVKVRLTEIPLLDRLLLIGAPGVGKTSVVKELAKKEATELGRVFVDLREADASLLNEIETHPDKFYIYLRIIAPHVMPEDINIPRSQQTQYFDFAIPRLLHLFTLKHICGVIFVDEITNIQRDDQYSLYYSLILEKEFGWGGKIADCVKIIAAANDNEWSELARPIPRPLRNRMIILYIENPNISEWIEYMDREYGEEGWDRTVAAYLLMYPEDFIRAPNEDDGFTAFATPRSWSHLAIMLKRIDNKKLREALIVGTVGPEVAAKFIAVAEEVANLHKIMEQLKENPTKFNELSVSQKILVIHHIAMRPNDHLDIIQHIDDEYLIMLIMLIPQSKRLQFLATHKEIARRVAHRIATIQ